jgi:Cu+-exporting ATPase
MVEVGSAAWTGWKAEEGVSPDETRVYLTLHGQPRGYYTFGNVYRPGLQRVVDELKPQMRLAVLSGDNAAEEPRLRQLFGKEAELNFRQSPVEKLQYVQGLKEQGHRVLMVGDGLNDAGALQQSEVGIALTDNVSGFSPSCDGILDAGHFARLSLFVRFAKVSMRIILASFGVSFIYNIIGLTMAVTGQFTPIVSAILMPTSTLSVILFATLAVRVAAKRMGL